MSKYESFRCSGFQWMSLWRSDKFVLTLSVYIWITLYTYFVCEDIIINLMYIITKTPLSTCFCVSPAPIISSFMYSYMKDRNNHYLTLTVLGYFAPWEYWEGGAWRPPPPPPPSDLGPEGADRREIWHAPQKLCKEKDLYYFSQKLHILLVMIIYANYMHQ